MTYASKSDQETYPQNPVINKTSTVYPKRERNTLC
jgi:hypothetical protein